MALIKCPECNNEISDTAKNCRHCGANVKTAIKKAEQERKDKEAQEIWKNLSPGQKIASTIITWTIIASILILIIVACNDTYDKRDGKCDICDKKAYSTINGDGGEYCYKHYKSTIDYYLDD